MMVYGCGWQRVVAALEGSFLCDPQFPEPKRVKPGPWTPHGCLNRLQKQSMQQTLWTRKGGTDDTLPES